MFAFDLLAPWSSKKDGKNTLTRKNYTLLLNVDGGLPDATSRSAESAAIPPDESYEMAAKYDMDLVAIAGTRSQSTLAEENRKYMDSLDQRSMADSDAPEPTSEEMKTLRRVSGKIPWQAYTITFVELCERFSYYGTTAVFVNFIQQPLPPFSTTGAISQTTQCYDAFGVDACEQPGALGRGQQASTGLTTFNQFWAYIMPLAGGYLADTYWGRYKTIQASIACAVMGHILLVISSIPQVMENPNGALGCFAVGLVIVGLGTGGFKSNISPLLGEQLKETRPEIIVLPSGERVIKDPAVTVSRVFLYFYMMINLGSLVGGIGMVYAERFVGFWLAYALPTLLFWLAPIVLIVCKPRYHLSPPTGSVTQRAFKLFVLASKDAWSLNPVRCYKNFNRADFWYSVKPSTLGNSAPTWMNEIDDAWVEQVSRGFNACKVFMWMPLYWLAYNQMVGNLTSQSAVMQLGGVPNDLINNLNPLTLIIFIPIMDAFIYPALRKAGIHFTPIKRIASGFLIASLAMVSACVVQYYIYRLSPCDNADVASSADCKAPISVWVQAIPYCFIAFSEIFASITSLEYAFTKAPENMRGLVMGVNLLQTSFSAAIGQALVPLSVDPHLVWNYGLVAVLAFLGGVGFWFTWQSLDAREDQLNMIQASKYRGRGKGSIS